MSEAPRTPPQEFATAAPVSVTVAADSIILTLDGLGPNEANTWTHRIITFEVDNTDANALDQFDVQIKAHANAAWVTYQATWVAGTPVGLRYVSTNLAALGATLTGTAILEVYNVYAIRFRGSSAVGTSLVTIQGALSDVLQS